MNSSGKEHIVISPSGQLYGSENVLFEFLEASHRSYKIYAPKGSIFYKKLKRANYKVREFKNLKWMYFKIFVQLIFSKKSLILNESGHVNYVKMLSKLLPNRKFVVIVRLLEDCNVRLNLLKKNITLIAVSKFIKENITSNNDTFVVYDPYQLKSTNESLNENKGGDYVIGIIGRVIETKGLDVVIEIFRDLSQYIDVTLNFYGTYDNNSVWFKNFNSQLHDIKNLNYDFVGFVENQESIFNDCDLILHLNKVEALGRVIFEAVDYNTPFLCFKEGGAGELAHLLNLSSCAAINEQDMVEKLKGFTQQPSLSKTDISTAKAIIKKDFNSVVYANKIEAFL